MEHPGKAGIVERVAAGRIQFALAFLGDFIRTHGAHHGANASGTPTGSCASLMEPPQS